MDKQENRHWHHAPPPLSKGEHRGIELELTAVHCEEHQNHDEDTIAINTPASSMMLILSAARGARQHYQILSNSNDMPFSLKPVLEIELSKLWSWIRWRTIDHIIQKTFYFPFVDCRGFVLFGVVSNHPLYHQISRFRWIRGQAIPIRCLGTLQKALWVDGFRLGLEVAILAPIHLGLLVLTLYHAFDILRPVVYCNKVTYFHPSFVEFLIKIKNSDQESLSGAFRSGLKVTLSPQMIVFFLPIIWGAINGFVRATINVGSGNEGFLASVKKMDSFGNNFWNGWMSGIVPLHPLSREFTGILKRFLWDGRLNNVSREVAFQSFCKLVDRRGFAKMMGFEALTQILYSCHVEDMVFLHTHQAFSSQECRQWFSMKSRAVEVLTAEGRWNWNKLLYCLYCRYLLWSVGLSLSWGDRIGWMLFKGGKLYTQVELTILIVQNIVSALKCPSPGTYTITGPTAAAGRPSESCLNAYISNFGNIPGQNISVITNNMDRFYLDSCRYTIDLTEKGLASDQVGPLISSFVKNQPDVTLVSLLLAGNSLDDASFFDDTLSLLTGLEILDLSKSEIGSLDSNSSISLGRGLSHLKSLTLLSLGSNAIGRHDSAGIEAVAAGLKVLTSLTSLDISTNNIGTVNSNGAVALGLSLSSLSLLTNLDLRYIGLEESDSLGTVAIGKSLSSLLQLRSLSIGNNNIGNHDSLGEQSIGLGIKYLTNLVNLAMASNDIGYRDSLGERAIANSLQYLTSLKTLKMENNYIGKTDSIGTQELGRSIGKLTSLTYFSLYRNQIGSTDSLGEISIGQGLASLSSIQTLLINDNQIGRWDSKGVEAIGNALKSLSALSSLACSWNFFGNVNEIDCANALADGIRNHKNIQTINIMPQAIQNSVRFSIIIKESISTTSAIAGDYWPAVLLTVQDIQEYFASIPRSSYSIILSNHQLVCPSDAIQARMYGDAIMRELAMFPNLTNLDISQNSLECSNSNVTQAIGDGLPTLASTLQHLRLDYNKIGSFDLVGLEHVSKGISSLSRLLELTISRNNLENEQHGSKGLEVICEVAIASLTLLTSLDLSDNFIGSTSTSAEEAVGNALKNLNSLQYLSLSSNSIGSQGSDGLVSIGNALHYLNSLSFLDLSYNAIGAVDSIGEIALSNGFRSLTTLSNLNLYGNSIGATSTKGPESIGKALKFLVNIAGLYLGVNSIGLCGPEGEIAIGDSLQFTTNLQQLTMEMNMLGSTGISGPAAIMSGLVHLKNLQILYLEGITNVTLPPGNFAPLVCGYNEALAGSCEEGICYGNVGNVSQLAFANVPPYLPHMLSGYAGSIEYAPGYQPVSFANMQVDCNNTVLMTSSSSSRLNHVGFWMTGPVLSIMKKGISIWKWMKNEMLDCLTMKIVQHCRETVESCPSYFATTTIEQGRSHIGHYQNQDVLPPSALLLLSASSSGCISG